MRRSAYRSPCRKGRPPAPGHLRPRKCAPDFRGLMEMETIDGESYRASGFDHGLHFHQTALAAARTGAAHRYEAEAANHPRDVFTVAAEAGQHSDVAIAEQPSRR